MRRPDPCNGTIKIHSFFARLTENALQAPIYLGFEALQTIQFSIIIPTFDTDTDADLAGLVAALIGVGDRKARTCNPMVACACDVG